VGKCPKIEAIGWREDQRAWPAKETYAVRGGRMSNCFPMIVNLEAEQRLP
jgi:hypothetical protein